MSMRFRSVCSLLVALLMTTSASAEYARATSNSSTRPTPATAAPHDHSAALAIAPDQRFNNVTYNGRFTFSRIMYRGTFGRRGGSSWSHDYPLADLNFPRILEYMTTMRVTTGRSNVFTLDDPRIFQHPMIYISEPGFWTITDSEALNLREYMLKGGLVILDDFENDQFYNMEAQMRRALPDLEMIEIGPDHEIFDSFFLIQNIYIPHPLVAVTPVYFAIFEDNDPDGRMMAIVNHNNDLAEYWEWSEGGYFPVDLTTEAYKIGVNYMIYAMTH